MTDLELHTPGVSELDAYLRQAEMLAASTLVPVQYRNKPADVLVASLAGREVGMGPWASLTYVVVINGKATMNAEGRVALIRKAGHSISGESTPARAVAHGKRRDTGDEMTVEWTIEMAKRANLVKNGPWTQYPEAMLWARAVSQLSRMLFADVLMGVSYDPEELGAVVAQDGSVIDVEPVADKATHESIRNIVAVLTPEQRDEFVAWYQAEGFPPIQKADRLTIAQADVVLARLDGYPADGVLEVEGEQRVVQEPEPTSPDAPALPLDKPTIGAIKGTAA